MNTTKSYSSGSQEGRNSFGKKSSQAGKYPDSNEYQPDDYQYTQTNNK